MIKKGDRLLVWSLQSFSYGGFLNGEPAFARQDSIGDSVLVCVIRNYKGEYKIDEHYEVYNKQVELVTNDKWKAKKQLKEFRKLIMANDAI